MRKPTTVPKMTFSPVNAPCERKNPTTNTSRVEEESTESTKVPMQPSTSAADKNQLPAHASHTKQMTSTAPPTISPASTTAQKYEAAGSRRGMGEASRSAVMPRFLSWMMTPQAHSGTVMAALAVTPTSIQLSQNACTAFFASAVAAPIFSSEARMPSTCTLPKNSTYSPSTMRGASSAKNRLARSFANTFQLRTVSR